MSLSRVLRRIAATVIVVSAMASLHCGGSPPGPGDPAPTVFSITPSVGPTGGGTAVQIGGTNFAAGATVTIGGVPATEVVVHSSTNITAKTPPRSAGTAEVSVNVGGRIGTLFGAFTYQQGEAPVVDAIVARGTRPNEPAGFADLNEEINVTATVRDPDTAEEQLQFQWSADVGTFSGSGASVTWRAPADGATPMQVTLTLNVSDGSSTATGTASVKVHNSIKEVGDLSRQFLIDFSDSNAPASYVVRNFSKSPRCETERDDEFNQIEDNRRTYRITSSSIGAASVTVQFQTRPCPYEPRNGDACAAIPATWNSVCVTSDPKCLPGRVEGVDFVTAVYEQSEWRLCASYFQSRGTVAPNFIR